MIWWRWWKCFLLAAGKKAAEDEHEHTYKNALYVIIVSSKFNDEIGESRQKSNHKAFGEMRKPNYAMENATVSEGNEFSFFGQNNIQK